MTHQGASDDMHSSWPSAAAVAGPPTAPVAAAAVGIMTVGGIVTVAGTILIFVVISVGLVSLQYFFDTSEDDGERHGARVSRRRGGGAAGGSGGIRARGVDQDLMLSLPVTVYRAALGSKTEEDGAVECAVCLAELEDGEEARFLPRCGHGFHAECVDTWLASHTTCPLCRLTVAKSDASTAPAPASALSPVPPEPANYAANLPASVFLGVSDGDARASTGTTGVLLIEIPELTVPTPTPRDAAQSPGSARPRSFRRLWSFGRQGAGPSCSCSSCGGDGEVADVEKGISVTNDIAVAEAQLPSEAAAVGTQRFAL